ncbi:lipopolysaccharide biosynthesis protein [Manganibacter manganicus]|nr:oligosaccharide flippase family protein [Pseudaminobacter manganicus]
MTLQARLARLTGNDMVRDVLRLVTGTVGGRVITLAAMPFVTRLYSPQDFALLAVYLGTVTMISAIACLRFDVAIPVAGDDSDAAHLLVLALLIAIGTALLGLIAVLLAAERIAGLLGQPALAPWLWLVPLGVFLSGSYSALQFWATRARRFGSIAMTRITQAAAGVSTMLALGWAGVAPLGLMLGNLLNASAGGFRLGIDALREDRTALAGVSCRGLVKAFAAYRRFPLYSAPEALVNMAGAQVPILIIAAFSPSEAGFLLLAQQVMAAPMKLLGSSISQVYVSRAPEEFRAGRLADFTLSTMRKLVVLGMGPLILAGVLAPILFPIVFGAEWSRAGEIVAWMVPWMALQFISSPVSLVMYVVGRQRAMLVLTLFGAIVRIGAVSIAAQSGGGLMIGAMIGASAIFYGVCLVIFIISSRLKLLNIIN